MKIAISDDNREDREKIVNMLKAYGKENQMNFQLEEYDSEELPLRNRRIKFPFVEGTVTLDAEEIIYIETRRHKNLFHTAEDTFSIYRKLDEIEEQLDGMGFLRIHQSYLVNMRYVEKISSYVMWLTTGEELSVPKSRYPEVKKRYALFKGTE